MNRRRLETLATFLETRVPRKAFNFNTILASNDQPNSPVTVEAVKAVQRGEVPECGAVGCAMGWQPAAFPRHWTLNRWGGVRLRKHSCCDTTEDTAAFYGMTLAQVLGLFYPRPECGSDRCRDEYRLAATATPKQVAKRIHSFLRGCPRAGCKEPPAGMPNSRGRFPCINHGGNEA